MHNTSVSNVKAKIVLFIAVDILLKMYQNKNHLKQAFQRKKKTLSRNCKHCFNFEKKTWSIRTTAIQKCPFPTGNSLHDFFSARNVSSISGQSRMASRHFPA